MNMNNRSRLPHQTFRYGLLLLFSVLLFAGCTAIQPLGEGELSPGQDVRTDVFKEGKPNPGGAFDSLYLLDRRMASAGTLASGAAQVNRLPESAFAVGDEVTLRIFHFNDLHNHLLEPNATRGDTHTFSQMMKIVEDARRAAEENEIVLFLSAGDDHIGTIFDELLGFDAATFVTSPAYRTYSAAGVDATVIGNHDLDRGSELLAMAIEQDAAFPVLSANLNGSDYLTNDLVSAAVVGVADGLRVGIIGLTTPTETMLHTKAEPNLAIADLLATLTDVLPTVAANSDVVILLTHVGYFGEGADADYQDSGVNDVTLAALADDLTDKPVIVVGGHTNVALNSEGTEVEDLAATPLILQASAYGQFMGEAIIHLQRSAAGWDSEAFARLIPLKQRDDRVAADDERYPTLEHDEDYDMAFDEEVIQPIYALLADRMDDIIGRAGELVDATTEATIADRYVRETAIANFMNDAIVARSASFPLGPDGQDQRVDIAVFNASGLISSVKPNTDIRFNDWYGVMPYADIVILVELTGAEIKDILDSNAQRIVRESELIENGGAMDPTDFISRGFLHFSSGVRYTIELGSDATQSVATGITIFDEPIENLLDQEFTVAINSYIGAGRGGWNGQPIGFGLSDDVPGFDLRTYDLHDTGLVYRNEIVNFIREVGEVSAETGAAKDGRLQIIP